MNKIKVFYNVAEIPNRFKGKSVVCVSCEDPLNQSYQYIRNSDDFNKSTQYFVYKISHKHIPCFERQNGAVEFANGAWNKSWSK